MSFTPTALPALPLREAIVDPLYRAVLSYDDNNLSLFESAFFEDAVFDFNGRVMEGRAAIKAGSWDPVAPLDTTHFLSNVRINLSSEDSVTATVTASALAQHFRAGQGNQPDTTRLTSGALYSVDVARDFAGVNGDGGGSGVWRIKRWRMRLVWTEGDWGVMTGN
ncbi:hypothetical protein ASPACDRAFT_40998 [Aspergillus aculeatus ATCC 16872]|uniref:SnoaL-like domain-containing protein n=1 Tax=Aspergillus aculeatus (strain ATCC 16872 / CBS 172.66 / WB 5094) TaxID=690307 RepID=A0A1L9X1J7_ASPA1|nr:uncharacterized protein ASPACDRAFT_40998 [Aspergillus aculeatus ATCC 16872]OJK02179.1 hypothetical protein ASPACDRAFT_40998 [Aspergillus aculeatus ATCC 16872]